MAWKRKAGRALVALVMIVSMMTMAVGPAAADEIDSTRITIDGVDVIVIKHGDGDVQIIPAKQFVKWGSQPAPERSSCFGHGCYTPALQQAQEALGIGGWGYYGAPEVPSPIDKLTPW